MSTIANVHGPTDSRQPRQSDRRGRSDSWWTARSAGRPSQRCQHGRPRSLGTARRRRRTIYLGKGVTKAVDNVNDTIAER